VTTALSAADSLESVVWRDMSDICVRTCGHDRRWMMKFVSVRDLRGKAADIWRELPEEREMVITSNGRPIAILAAVGESDLEEALAAFRKARAIDAVASLQLRSVSAGRDALTAEDVEAEIATVREARAR
jgi:antitoxin (DNA-binding transcriptional repressor) of toxin-antitoxin stability system